MVGPADGEAGFQMTGQGVLRDTSHYPAAHVPSDEAPCSQLVGPEIRRRASWLIDVFCELRYDCK